MTVYCYDTEFLEDGNTIELISIGIVCEDGREYYAVNHDADWKRIETDDWLMANVIPHLPMRRGEKPYKFEHRSWIWGLDADSVVIKPKWLIANEVRDFMLAGLDTSQPPQDSTYAREFPELWAYYAAYDHVALAQLWGPMRSLPKGMPMYTHDLKQEMDRLSIPEIAVPQPENAHDALADARWNMAMLREILGGEANF